MNAFIALSYGDRRALVNTVRSLRRRPGRAVMWSLYAVFIVGLAILKTGPWSRRNGAPQPFATDFSDLWVCGLAIGLGVVLATGTARWLGVFSSRAEALVLTRGDAAPVTVAAYLQVRTVVTALASGATRFAYVIVFGLPAGTTFGALVPELAFFAASGAAIASIPLPRALARGAARIATIVAGWTIVVAGALPLVADGLRIVHVAGTAALMRRLPAVHPGNVLTVLAHGDLRAIAIPLAVAVCATVAFALAARDAYPELYALSLANLDWRERARARRRPRDTAAAKASRAKTVRITARTSMRGALAFVWLDAVMFGRRVSRPMAALLTGLALSAGAAIAVLMRSDNGEIVLGVLFSLAPIVYISLASTTGVRLAPVLRMPLFWLGAAPLGARLAAWTFGGFWRDATLLALVAVGYAAIGRTLRIPLAVFVGLLGLLALARAIGLAVFAIMPNALDQRGPGVLLRAWLSIVLPIPAIAAGAIAVFVSGSPLAGTIAATVAALAESALLLIFAAWRLAGRVDNLALS